MIRLAILVATLTAAAPAAAASFDCARARAADEIAICRSPVLSNLDTAMAAHWFAYSRIPMAMGGSGARRDDARDFLRARHTCRADAACLARLYRARIAVLQGGIAGAMAQLSHITLGTPLP